ncbi:uncharacterized protein [Epargyreus clarus]|uniref:uncharacterized protein isoform X1 n=1 Tax=Epargyreus clarus TaxID=520877 RepID=UPI003C2AE7D3
MESLIRVQLECKRNIEKSQINFRKSPKERITLAYVQTRSETLEQKWKEFIETHKSIIEIASKIDLEKNTYFTTDIYEKIEEIYIEYKTELKQHMINFEIYNNPVEVKQSTLKTNNLNVKLPKISLPNFSGQYTEWTSFRDLFLSLIDKNEALDDVQKLHYLKGHLSGEAEQLLRHTPVTAANYRECWTTLTKRYDNKKFLSNNMLKRLINQPALTKESSAAIKGLLDNTVDCLQGLRTLGIDVDSWDVIVIFIISSKLDFDSRKLWESQISACDNLPTFNEFKIFLESRFRALEYLDPKLIKPIVNRNNVKMFHVASESCILCSGDHRLYNCKEFAKQDTDSRREFARTNNICFNCLGKNHTAYNCRHSTRCRLCKKRHHSLLHPKNLSKSTDNEKSVADVVAATSSSLVESTNVVSCFSDFPSQSLLATALVEVKSKNRATVVLRALLDQGSQASFITESAVQLLGLKKIPTRAHISRLGDEESGTLPSRAMVDFRFHSRLDPSFVLSTKAYVLSKLTSLLPEKRIVSVPSTLSTMDLADPSYGVPNKIDLILGAGVYGQILLEGVIKGPPGTPVAQKTTLGWILSGNIRDPHHHGTERSYNVVVGLHTQINCDDLLKKFWELESDQESSHKKHLTADEQRCEQIFSDTTIRDESGRYVVKLPFRHEDPSCKYGNTENIARKRFNALEKKFHYNPEFRNQYSNVIQEYIDLGHMERVPDSEIRRSDVVYLPHHAVVRNDKSTSKLRVVFDASCLDSNGVSLNNELLVGPTLQPELRHIIMRWRRHPVALVADIVKMYRQVKVFPEDADYQRLLWREKPDLDLLHLRLLRVTFGTSSAPYLAVRALQQLAHDEGKDFPMITESVLKDFYVDDLMTGCESVAEGVEIYKKMNQMLNRGGFQLQKWSSNSEKLLKEIKEESGIQDSLEIKTDEVLKILGLTWNRTTDEFQYTVQLPELETPVVKRKVISDIAKLYDPLGWLAPVIVTAKIFIQKIWLTGIDWDDELPSHLLEEWLVFRNTLGHLTQFRMHRWLGTYDNATLELQGFCDASNGAYAAVVYARVVDCDGVVHVILLSSKTKVAPIKQVSIPRLELCGAVLLARLLHEISETLEVAKENVHAWTDSTVVLAWLRSHPSRWKTFVANRVSEILTTMDAHQWSHVRSNDNPADYASRGVLPSAFAKFRDVEVWS